jgi:hypothetical protein
MKNLSVKYLIPVVALGLIACAPPRVLITNNYLGSTKISKSYLIQRSDNDKQFDYYVRVCDVKGDKALTVDNCKDTLVVDKILR